MDGFEDHRSPSSASRMSSGTDHMELAHPSIHSNGQDDDVDMFYALYLEQSPTIAESQFSDESISNVPCQRNTVISTRSFSLSDYSIGLSPSISQDGHRVFETHDPRSANLFSLREATRPKFGWWKGQMRVDRTLRIMAALMIVLAITMTASAISVVVSYLKSGHADFRSTSVTIASGSKEDMNARGEILKFVINIASTLVLGMSNTYQHIVTALDVDDIRHALTKYGDCRVATNSPFAIMNKRKGRRLAAFAAWVFLLSTSLPVHLIANSLIGTSLRVGLVNSPEIQLEGSAMTSGANMSYDCWNAFRLGSFPLNQTTQKSAIANTYSDSYYDGFAFKPQSLLSCQAEQNGKTKDAAQSWDWEYVSDPPVCRSTVSRILYDEEVCGSYRGTSLNQYMADNRDWWRGTFTNCTGETSDEKEAPAFCQGTETIEGDCSMNNFKCEYLPDPVCEEENLVVRASAAVILALCFSAKAIYMVLLNYRWRQKTKSHCLTFGDVVVASVLEDIKIPSECLVNGGDFHRQKNTHSCHAHCKKANEKSATGDELGHCQKCKKFNTLENMTGLPWPVISTKHKKSLITNLGHVALTQITTLSLLLMIMLFASVVLGLAVTEEGFAVCRNLAMASPYTIKAMYGQTLWNELSIYAISNGPQLIYSTLYLLLLYNLTLISLEHDWSQFERKRDRLRCTIVRGAGFKQSYRLQLPLKIIFPLMGYSIVMHWTLGISIYVQELVFSNGHERYIQYWVLSIPHGVIASTALLLIMTATCWWAYTYKREGYIPQVFGSIRTLCAATSELEDFPPEGIMWGDRTKWGNSPWRHAGLTSGFVQPVIPNELYA